MGRPQGLPTPEQVANLLGWALLVIAAIYIGWQFLRAFA